MKSIEELARELVEDIANSYCDITIGEVRDWQCFIALKSALERPVEKEPEWPKYFKGQFEIIRFDNDTDSGVWQEGNPSFVWTYPLAITNGHFTPIPTAEALAIIEKAKVK